MKSAAHNIMAMILLRCKISSLFLVLTAALLFAGTVQADEQLTWEECLMQASQHHPDLVSAKEGIRQSQDAKAINSSGLWPQIGASAGITKSIAHNASSVKSSSSEYSYGLSGSQLLFDGFKTINNVKASQENIKASQWNFQFVSSETRLNLRTAFVNLLKAQELVKLTVEIRDIRKQNLDLITLRYNSGTEHKGALLTAQANLAESEFEIHQAGRSLLVAQRALLKEIGSKTIEPVAVTGNFDIQAKYIETPDFEHSAKDNPQLLKLAMQINAASFNVKSNKGDFWPAVSLIGGTGKSDNNWPPKADSSDVGIKLSWSLLEGGSRLSSVDQAKSVVRDLQAQQQSLNDKVVVALEQAWSTLEDTIEQVGVQKKFLEAVEERAKIAQQQYSVGLISYDNWTIIEDDLVSNKKTFLNIETNALVAEAKWIEAQGRNLEYAS